jgi:hypothetical protein
MNKEDIESLGWTYRGRAIDQWFEKEGSFDLRLFKSYLITMHYNMQDFEMTIEADDPSESNDYVLFRGIIKDKKDLEKVMELIRIDGK